MPQQVPQNHQMRGGHVPPTTVRAVESAYFKQHQYVQQMARPLAEVLGQGNFFFLQESELDSPEVPNNNASAERQPVHQIGVSFPEIQIEIKRLKIQTKRHILILHKQFHIFHSNPRNNQLKAYRNRT